MEQLEEGKYPKENENYDYLLKMPIYNLTKDKIDEFNDNLNKKESEYKDLSIKDNKQLWNNDLTLLEPKLAHFKINKKLKLKLKVKAKSSK
jgi:DNA topoisomerase-2